MRRGTVFRRCTRCRRRMQSKRCGNCGADSGTWYYHVDVQGPGGRRRQEFRGGFSTKADATAAMVTAQSERAAGIWVETSKITVAEYLDRWLAGARVRATTRKSYAGAVEKLRPLIGDVRLQQLDRIAIKAAYEKLASTKIRGKRPARKTVHNVHLALSAALAAAVDDRLIRSNPAQGAHKFSRDDDQEEMRYWSAGELRIFLAGIEGQDHALYHMLAYTGMRRGEALGLRWEDVDLDAARLSVRQQVTRIELDNGYVWGFGPPKTRAGRRTIDLDPETIEVLRRQKARQARFRLAMGSAYDGDLVFARPDGRYLDPDVVSETFDKYIVKVNAARRRRAQGGEGTVVKVSDIRLHDLRHTHATILLKANKPVKVVSERLGHSKVSTTQDLYQHVIPGMQQEAAVAFAAIVDGAK